MQKQIKTKTIFDPRFNSFISDLVKIRNDKNLTQRALSAISGYKQCSIAKIELRQRRLDFIETIDYMRHLGLAKTEIAAKMAEWVEAFA